MSQPRRLDHHRRGHATAATVGLVVEGETEFTALPLLYKAKLIAGCPPLKPSNLNGVGSHLTAAAIAKMVTPKVQAHFAAGRKQVIVCLDREQRADCPGGFAAAIQLAVLAELSNDASLGTVQVVAADRTFEAWLLAGAQSLFDCGALKSAPKFGSFEGKLGARQRKGIDELSRLLGREYAKTKDGPSLFKRLDFDAARRASKSLDKLLRTMGV